ncbi:hypothetical protein NUW58_g4845 [Xylaria curta]|uniref:Uncharacterized protein n=1 Tax=Xylaria curta TaxID=42375 RepID=A0ACC1P6V6_9PEZI|nr:hypothetical protein NUW58_g4845 [Xylaria curta]
MENTLHRNGAGVRQQGSFGNHQPQTSQQPEGRTPSVALLARAIRILPQVYDGNVTYGPAEAEGATMFSCAICGEKSRMGELYNSVCGHRHCIDCLKANARVAFASNPFAPAKCCHVLPPEVLYKFGALTEDELKQYTTKMEELANPHTKLYCWSCSAYVPYNRRTKRVGDCEQCGKRTCKSCQAKSHFGACDRAKLEANREAEERIYHLAKMKGWKRCPNCLNMVQKSGGCNHMLCNCGQDFCYLCGQVYDNAHTHDCEQQRRQRHQQQQRFERLLQQDPHRSQLQLRRPQL